jgi:hypothetical protein
MTSYHNIVDSKEALNGAVDVCRAAADGLLLVHKAFKHLLVAVRPCAHLTSQ